MRPGRDDLRAGPVVPSPAPRGEFGDARGDLRWVCAQAGAHPSRARVRAAVARPDLAALHEDTELRPTRCRRCGRCAGAGLRIAVVSDCGYELPALLPRLPVAPLLDAGVYSVEVGSASPHPAMYLEACRRLGVAPEECLYVGDGGSHELTGAERLGMTAVRLAAPDLARHLVFDAEQHWSGPTVTVCGRSSLWWTGCLPSRSPP